MPSLLPRPTRLSATDLPFAVFLATVGLCLLRAADLPSVELSAGGTELSIGPADVMLLATAVLAARQLWSRRTIPSPWLLGATAAFALLIVVDAVFRRRWLLVRDLGAVFLVVLLTGAVLGRIVDRDWTVAEPHGSRHGPDDADFLD